MGRGGLVSIPLRSFSSKCVLEQPKTDGIIGNGIGGTPHVERSDMVGWIFSSKAFEHRDVGGELGWHSRPTNIVADRVIDQLIEIGEAEACDVWQQGCG